MRVLFATAELAPVTAVGGLGEAVAGLVGELRSTGRRRRRRDPRLRPGARVALAGEVRRRIAVPAWAAPASVRIGEHAVAGRLHLVSVPGIERSHPYLRPDGTGWPDNAGPLPRVQPGRGGDGARATRPTCCTSTTGTPAPCSPPSPTPPPSRADAAQRRLPGRHRRLVAAPASDRAAATTSGGAAPTRCRAASRSPTASSPCRRTTPPRSSRRPAGSGSTGRCATAAPRVIGIRNGIDTARWDPATDATAGGALRRRAGSHRRPPGPSNRRALLERCRVARRRDAARRDGDPAHRAEGRRPRSRRSSPCCATSRCASSCSASARRRWPRRSPALAADHPAIVRLRRALRRAARPPAVRRRRRVRDAEPVRAVRPGPDAGDALRRDPGRHAGRRAASTPCPTSTPSPTATASSPTPSSSVGRRVGAVPRRPPARRPPPTTAARAPDHGARLVVAGSGGGARRRVPANRGRITPPRGPDDGTHH